MTAAFLWGLFAASSLLVGALIVFARKPSTRVLGLIMGFGAGVLLSAVSFELVEEAIGVGGGTGGVFTGFFVGALVFYAGDVGISRMGRDRQGGGSGLAIVLGTVLDGIPESAVLGLTLLQTGSIGVSILVAVFVSNIPEAISASSDLLESGWTKPRILVLWSIVVLVSGAAAALGYALLDGAEPGVLAFVLAFAGGAILTMLSITMIPEAFEEARRPVGLATVFGFAVAFGIDWLVG